jgi:UDP-glucuronate 4-epimerase
MIGTSLGLALLNRGAIVAGVDRRPNPWTDQIPTTLMDLCTPGALDTFDWPADLVVHLAAHAKVHATVCNPVLAYENFVAGTAILELARLRRVPLILGSSREVYGNVKRTRVGEKAVFVDKSASPYSATKLAIEALGHSYRRCYGLPIVILRFSNVYGRYDTDLDRLERVVPLFFRQIATASPVVIFGAEKRLDFTFIDDCVAGILKTIEAMLGRGLTDHVINIASGRGYGLTELATLIGEAVGKRPIVVLQPTRAGEVVHYVARLDVARRALGYRSRVMLPEGIRRALAWQSARGDLSPVLAREADYCESASMPVVALASGATTVST